MTLAWLTRPYWTWAQVMFIVAAALALFAVIGTWRPFGPSGWVVSAILFFVAVGLFLAF